MSIYAIQRFSAIAEVNKQKKKVARLSTERLSDGCRERCHSWRFSHLEKKNQKGGGWCSVRFGFGADPSSHCHHAAALRQATFSFAIKLIKHERNES